MSPVPDRLGPYEIVEPLGAGGMGEVWLATDTRLGRKVAIKVLPERFASDPERLARFEQEARAAAALNHPNIAVVHDVGESGGTHFMVQEYLEGQTLRELLRKGPLKLERALTIGVEVGEALAVAHRAGIVHRDIKPENIFVSASGHAKVLDFGLAKLTEVAAGQAGPSSMSPTALATQTGVIMGTAGYMAPEQVNGEDVDARADVFSLGCVLYEAATGRGTFAGKNVVQTLDRIVNGSPAQLEQIDASLPAQLQWILDKCLAKARERRYQHADDLVVDLRGLLQAVEGGSAETIEDASAATGPHAADARVVTLRSAAAAALALAAVVAVLVWVVALPDPVDTPLSGRFLVLPPEHAPAAWILQSPDVAISADGRRIVYDSRDSNGRALAVRDVDSYETRLLDGLGRSALGPFFSPDGEWVGFHDDSDYAILKVSVLGGPPVRIVELSGSTRGTSWGPDGTLVFATTTNGDGLSRVDAGGGEIEQLTTPDADRSEFWHRWPQWLPDGRHVLFTIRYEGDTGRDDIALLDVETRQYDVLLRGGSNPVYVASGHIVYAVEGSLRAVTFDLTTLSVSSDPRPVVSGVNTKSEGGADFAVSYSGTLVYLPTSEDQGTYDLVWVDRDGDASVIREFDTPVRRPRLSPDGRYVAFEIGLNAASDIHVVDLVRGSTTRLSRDGGDFDPVWTPDGRDLVFSSDRGNFEGLYIRRASGAGEETPLPHRDMHENAYSFTSDGRTLAVYTRGEGTARDIWVLSRDADWAPTPVLVTEFNERTPALSPDGRWLAYTSDESGRDEVYILSFPSLDAKYTISIDGGRGPAWSASGRELYYRNGSDMLVVSVDVRSDVLEAGAPQRLFSGPYRTETTSGSRSYDVAGDGRFVMVRRNQGENSSANPIHVVTNWFGELKRMFDQ